MTFAGLHASVPLLLYLQTRAGLRRIRQGLQRPQHLISAIIAILLAMLWLANAVASVWLRESADPRGLEVLIAFSLSAYMVWHLVRVGCFRPEHPLEQTDHQREILVGLPLTSRDIVAYHLVGIAMAATVKAALLALLLMPDLPLPLVGWLGILVALLAVELSRNVIEILVWGLPPRIYWMYRAVVVTALVTAGFPSLLLVQRAVAEGLSEGGNVLSISTTAAIEAHGSAIGTTLCTVWRPCLELVLAENLSLSFLGWFTLAGGLLTTLAGLVLLVYQRTTAAVIRREQRSFSSNTLPIQGRQRSLPCSPPASAATLPRMIMLMPLARGTGMLFWRQAKGAGRHAWGLLVAMAPPAALALSPLVMPISAEATFLSVVCALAFYTFLLLPTALKFDFRRDLDRMGLLKSLPVGPLGVTVGQIATPVVLATGFQIVVIGSCQIMRPVATVLPLSAIGLLMLMNLFVFALDNLVFLRYPHRLQQEGLSVLLRTMLTFTAKGLLFGLGLLFLQAWRLASLSIADFSGAVGCPLSGATVFVSGVVLVLALTIAVLLSMLAAAVSRFDPAEHLPAA